MRSWALVGASLSLGSVLCAAACNQTGPTRSLTKLIELDKAEAVAVELTMSGGELNVRGGTPKLLDATFTFNVPAWEPVIEYTNGTLRVRQPDNTMSFGNNQNTWNITLNDRVPMSLTADLGGGQASLTLGSLNVSALRINTGAGELNLDLRGAPKRSYEVRVNGGVGSAHIRLPGSVGIVATAEAGLGSIDVRGLEKHGKEWVNTGHENDPVAIHLAVKGGIGEVVIGVD